MVSVFIFLYFCIVMKIFTSNQIRELDQYTIEHEPIRGIDLMERAAKTLARAISEEWTTQTPMVAFAGPGNNGGDALAVSRLLAEQGYRISVYLFNINKKLSEECATNKKRIAESKRIMQFTEVTQEFDPPKLDEDTVVIDGLFGSGLTKPLAGGFALLVKYINQSAAKVVSIDMPSGLMTEDNTYNVRANIVKADITLTLQHKKLSFLFPENQQFTGRLKVLDIRLSAEGTELIKAQYGILEENDVRQMLLPRDPYSHKGNMGSALVVAGSFGMAGAAAMAAKACYRAGAGKVTVHTPRRNNDIIQISVPEAVVNLDHEETYIGNAIATEDFDAMAIGSGLGQVETTAIAMISQIRRASCPIVVDADALNILSNHRAWLQQMPKGVIMTPHPREFDRINGAQCADSYERLSKARNMAEHLEAYILLKGHHSALCMPDGSIMFNSTGNAGMATAGSGDVLTGIITGLLARGYKHADACMLGMYLHGLAGDLAAKDKGEESLMATDIIEYMPKAFDRLKD